LLLLFVRIVMHSQGTPLSQQTARPQTPRRCRLRRPRGRGRRRPSRWRGALSTSSPSVVSVRCGLMRHFCSRREKRS